VVTTALPTVDDLRAAVSEVADPEIPVLTIADLGVLRDVEVVGGQVTVTITPTYSGCPAMAEIAADVRAALAALGVTDVEVRTVLSPAWTTDWMTEAGRERLREYGIAPPGPRPPGPVSVGIGRRPQVACPQCGSADTEELTRFASTSCQALWRCLSCREPFGHFKAH
jgi:ring-1,2-phenylacetyl-CoA epoxidase subunit PaaD